MDFFIPTGINLYLIIGKLGFQSDYSLQWMIVFSPDFTWKNEPIEVEIRPTITDIDAKAKEYANSVTDNEKIKKLIINAFKAGHNI